MAKIGPVQVFNVQLVTRGNGVCFIVPFNVQEEFGKKSQIKVQGSIEGCLYRSSLFPIGDGTYYMVVTKLIRTELGKSAGD